MSAITRRGQQLLAEQQTAVTVRYMRAEQHAAMAVEPLRLTCASSGADTAPHVAFGWRIHCGVEVTKLSTNKQHTLSAAAAAAIDASSASFVASRDRDDVVYWYSIQ